MKYLLTLILSALNLLSLAQNSTPQIEITGIERDAIQQTLTVNYALSDADNDACEIWLKISLDGGIYFGMVSQDKITGHVGLNIKTSNTRSLVWDYSGLMKGIENINIRLFASDHKPVNITEMVNQVNQTKLLSTLEAIVGERHFTAAPNKLAEVRTFIKDAFSDANIQTEGHDFVLSNTNMQNILGRKPGAKDEGITYIIDGHFDGVPNSPAADDNGSAIAGMLEALRILSLYSFENSIRFIGFDAEELGLVGSQNYIVNGIKPFEDIRGVLNLEMIGFYSNEPNTQILPAGFGFLFPQAAQKVVFDQNRGNFLFTCANTNSNPLLKAFKDASAKYVPKLRLITVSVPGTGSIAPDLRRSDHAPFWDAGLEALMITDTSEFRNSNYHTTKDKTDTLNLEFMQKVVQATLATIAELAIPISANFDEADLSDVLNIKEHHDESTSEISIFPNPSNGLLFLNVKGAKTGFRSRVEVYELTGKRVYREVLNFKAGTSNSEINLQHLAKGSYLLILNFENTTKSIGFIIAD